MIALYRLGLLLLPPAFRRDYGADLLDHARVQLDEARGRRARFTAALELGADLTCAVLREWWDVVVQESRTGLGGGVVTDLRQAARGVLRGPAFAAAVVTTLGFGIGVTTVAVGLVDTYLLRSLPYPEGGEARRHMAGGELEPADGGHGARRLPLPDGDRRAQWGDAHSTGRR